MAVYPLKQPIDVNGKRYEVLTLRRADAGAMRYLDRSGTLALVLKLKEDLEKAAKSGASREDAAVSALPQGLIDKMAPFFARVADVDEAVIDRLDAADYMGLFEKLDEVMAPL